MKFLSKLKYHFSVHRCDEHRIAFKDYQSYQAHILRVHQHEFVSDEGIYINNKLVDISP
jgi:hypothetical protein